MKRKMALLTTHTGRLALARVTVRQSTAAPARLKVGLVSEAALKGAPVTVAIAPEWRMELN